MSEYFDRQAGFAAGQSGKRPECVTDDHLAFLDALRESGATNMFGARPYILEEFPELSEEEASAALGYWMKTFAARKVKSEE